jgi:hypothetical protein
MQADEEMPGHDRDKSLENGNIRIMKLYHEETNKSFWEE